MCVCVYLRSIRSITSHIATHALLLLRRSPLWLLRVDCFGVSFSITFVHLCACCCCCLPFSTCFQLRCPQCASLKTIGHIHCVPSSSLHAHDINMAEFACMAGRYADYCQAERACLCVSFAVRSNIVTDTQRHAANHNTM